MKMRKRMSWPIIVAVAAALAVVGFLVAPVFGILTHQVAKHCVPRSGQGPMPTAEVRMANNTYGPARHLPILVRTVPISTLVSKS